jgi:hypothetical protein
MFVVCQLLRHGKEIRHVATHVEDAKWQAHEGGQEKTARERRPRAKSTRTKTMNTVHHRDQIERTVSKLFESDSAMRYGTPSNCALREAIIKVAAAVQAIIVEIERTRSR